MEYAVVLELEFARESSEGLISIRVAGTHPQSVIQYPWNMSQEFAFQTSSGDTTATSGPRTTAWEPLV